jgi:uncharacterized protein YggT (Ycf19 family)
MLKLALVLAIVFSLSFTSGALLEETLRFIQPLIEQGVKLKPVKEIVDNLLYLDFRSKAMVVIYHLCWPRGP